MPARSYQRPSREILVAAHKKRRQTLNLDVDQAWLEEITGRAQDVLSQMSRSGQLHRVGERRYVLAAPGTSSLAQNASPELVADLLLRPRPYYLGWLTALIDHRLTDIHSREVIVGVPQGTRLRGRVPIELKLVQVSSKKWPSEDELVRSRAISGKKEFVWRSTVERSLVDSLSRPDLSGGIETVALAWARAAGRPDVSWTAVAASAKNLGDAAMRRTAFFFRQLGLDAVADEHLLGEFDPRRTSTLLDREHSFELPGDELTRDPATGVVINVPRDYLRGWLSGEAG